MEPNRDWFAGMALQGMLSAVKNAGGPSEFHDPSGFAERAYDFADAMLEQKIKHQHKGMEPKPPHCV